MSRYAGLHQLACKIEWEGGIEDALEYGIKSEDMPEGHPALEWAWAEMEKAWDDYVKTRERVEELIPDPYDE